MSDDIAAELRDECEADVAAGDLPGEQMMRACLELERLAAEVERLKGELAETKEGWRQGVLQKEINCLPQTEAAVHIEELQTENAKLRNVLEAAREARGADHDTDCARTLRLRGCRCGHTDLLAAIAACDESQP